MRKFVITAGPGAGKTTTLERIAAEGHVFLKEAARAVKRAEKTKAKAMPGYEPILPETNLPLFEEMISHLHASREAEADADPLFVDRDHLDTHAYCQWGGIDTPEPVMAYAWESRPSRVFVLEPLPYENDADRPETPEQAAQIHRELIDTYRWAGADIVELPLVDGDWRANAKARAAMVLDNLVEDTDEEVERKYRVPGHDTIRSRLNRMGSRVRWSGEEYTRAFPTPRGYERLRRGESYEHAVKSARPDGGRDEHTTLLSEQEYLSRMRSREGGVQYTNITEQYEFVGSDAALVSLDCIVGLGCFVEVEARTWHHVDALAEELGLREEVPESYVDMVGRAA